MYTHERNKCFDLPEFNIWAGAVTSRQAAFWYREPTLASRATVCNRLVIDKWFGDKMPEFLHPDTEWNTRCAYHLARAKLPRYWMWDKWASMQCCCRVWFVASVAPCGGALGWDQVQMRSLCLVHFFCFEEEDPQTSVYCDTFPGDYCMTVYRQRDFGGTGPGQISLFGREAYDSDYAVEQ